MQNILKIERNDVYELIVNDNGDVIAFELGDISLPFRLNEAYGEIDKIQNWLRQRLTVIEKQKDHKDKNSVLTHNQIQTIEAQKKAFADMRKAMDKFLGAGGVQKIFGDSNYLEMYNDLFDALSKPGEDGLSHLDKMKLSNEAISKRIEEKYKQTKEQVI